MAALANLLGENAQAEPTVQPARSRVHFEPRAKRIIYLFQSGGPAEMANHDEPLAIKVAREYDQETQKAIAVTKDYLNFEDDKPYEDFNVLHDADGFTVHVVTAPIHGGTARSRLQGTGQSLVSVLAARSGCTGSQTSVRTG